MSTISDWTEQARAESALRETEARFRQLAENIEELVFITDASRRHVQYVNPRQRRRLFARSLPKPSLSRSSVTIGSATGVMEDRSGATRMA